MQIFKSTYYLILFTILVSVNSCKKAEERTCWKSNGEFSVIEHELDSVHSFKLYKNIRYHFYEDTLYKIVVRGGKNLVNFIDVENLNGELSVRNLNKCNFLRSNERVQVEIHYPHFKHIYIEPSDSVVFKNTIHGDSLLVEIRNGGGSTSLDVDVNFLRMNVSYGTGDYMLSGKANNAEVKIQNNGFADASQFYAPVIFIFNNSTGDLKVDLDSSYVIVGLEGTGDIYYRGSPDTLIINNPGSGSLINY